LRKTSLFTTFLNDDRIAFDMRREKQLHPHPYYSISTVMLSLRVSASSGVPVYLQIEQQIKQCVASGVLEAGDALPSTRRLAGDLRVNPNTVARAFQNLERDGIIRTVPGGGTYVAETFGVGMGLLKAEKIRRLRPLATQFVVEAFQLRLGADEMHRLLDAVLQELGKTQRGGKSGSRSEVEGKDQ
jgi:GntR family transcriptional regulator